MSAPSAGASFFVDGIAFWAPTLPGWALARAAFRGEAAPLATPVKRPGPEILAPAERRRAPDTVALALEVAAAAVAASGRAAVALPAIFTSAHGDLAVNDYMCATLASQPTLISPTRFHNSVHNAAAGYWTIATGCREASTALTSFDASFAAGLLEAAAQCAADARAVLLVGFDVAATGPLAAITASEGMLACALVMAPRASARTLAAFDWSLAAGPSAGLSFRSEAARSLAGNAMADALPLLEAIAFREASKDDEPIDAGEVDGAAIALRLSRSLSLRLTPRAFAAVAAGDPIAQS